MDFEPWMLLAFPLFFGMGWLAARIDIKELLTESSALPRSYFDGLNFLLNEQQDQAIEAFIEVVKVDPQTIELHFALGSLFRRRGEVDRAIRMHLNLVERDDLEEERKQQALFELAQDYLKGGILDRAEDALQRLPGTEYEKPAAEFLLDLYQKEKEWLKAIDVGHRLEALTGESQGHLAAFFYCELAALELAKNRDEAAFAHLEQALTADPKNVRASIMLGMPRWPRAGWRKLSGTGKTLKSKTRNICRWWRSVCWRRTGKRATERREKRCCAAGCNNIPRSI